MLSDQMLLREAERRMKNAKDEENMTQKELMDELGISESELDDVEVDIE